MNIWLGTIKQNATNELDKIAGTKLLILNGIDYQKENEVLILHPARLEDFERYYKHAFEIMGKEWISEDYKDFLIYMLNPDCEFASTTSIANFEDLIKFTDEIDKKCFEALCEFKMKYLSKVRTKRR